MINNIKHIEDYMQPNRRVHLVGIGGVSMSPLAEVLQRKGLVVQGSDMNESPTVLHLRSLGIPVSIGHSEENLGSCEFVIRTAAVHNDNPEISSAITRGIPVFERAEAWGTIMQHYRNAICIAGTHGKTTTTAMSTYIFMAAQQDPTVMIGGTLPLLHSGYRVGHGDTIILESCEYRNSFLSFFPTVAVLLNVEADHLDFFKDLEDVEHSFRRFAQLTPDDGHIIANMDDSGVQDVLTGLNRPVFTFGLHHDAHCTAVNRTDHSGYPSFDIQIYGKFYAHVDLQVFGDHNVSNALAAASAAYVLGIPGTAVQEGLSKFSGAGRRFEKKGVYHGAEIYDDYAHHPSELHALLEAVQTLPYERVIVAFQPHTYSRTHKLFHQFVEELHKPTITLVAEIFAARETNTIGISSADLCEHIPGAVYCPTLEQVTDKLSELARPGDLILTVGAGDIVKAGEALLKRK